MRGAACRFWADLTPLSPQDEPRTFTLYKLAERTNWPDNADGSYYYRSACEALGLQPVGCADNNYWQDQGYAKNAVSMPSEWGCNMGDNGQLSADTGWDRPGR